MKAIKIPVVLLLCLLLTEATDPEPQLEFLDKLFKIMNDQDTIETIIILQHRQDLNCPLQRWNSREIPVLRSNELSSFEVRRIMKKQLLVMVCIDGDSDHILLNALAKILENLRQYRIILWTQKKPTRDFLADILEQVVKFKFLRIIVIAMDTHSEGVLSFHRLHAFPSPRFVNIKNNSNMKDMVFPNLTFNYKGLPATVKIPPSDFTIPVKTKTGLFPISNGEDMEIVEFSRRYNLDLKLYDENLSDHFDIQLNPQFIRQNDSFAQTEFVSPSSISSLLVVVPCCNNRSLKCFMRKLDLQTWLLYLLPVYGTFVLVESLVLVVTQRMYGESYRLTNLNPLLNLRAFRAILGLPFPELRRASISLRQLSLAITIFEFIFSNCFSCKLTAMLTKPLPLAEVRNFEELRASGLTTITDEYIHSFIENNIDSQFFNQVIPNFMILKSVDPLSFVFSLNESYSYSYWPYYQKFLSSTGKMNHCTSKDLIIARNLPRMYVLESNSIFKWMLSRFVMYAQEAGITEHWNRFCFQFLIKAFNLTVQQNVGTRYVPLSLQQFNWLWHLLAIGYGIATVAFLVEIFLKKRRGVGQQKHPV
ncbi:hypothetical protein KR059_002655 [Drosophila kikkawai]|nr:hypothetical protein KR059_002655 [Drosophila kikkawai]